MTETEFTTEITRLQPTLKALTHRFTYDREVSADLVQDTLLRAFQYRENYRRNTNLSGWLFTIMRNTYINQYRKTQRAGILTPEGSENALRLIEGERTSCPARRLELDEVWRNVNTLEENLRLPFKMHTSGYKYEEIASRLGIPVGTVKNRIFHARKEIQKKLEGYR